MTRYKILIWSVVLVIVLSPGLGSCTKQKSAATPYERVQGKWKLIKFGSDDNLNGTIEDAEKHFVSSEQDNEVVFNADGTGVNSYAFNNVSSPDVSFNWKIITDGALWVAYSANDTIAYHLEEVSASDMTLTTQGAVSLEWYYYIKK